MLKIDFIDIKMLPDKYDDLKRQILKSFIELMKLSSKMYHFVLIFKSTRLLV